MKQATDIMLQQFTLQAEQYKAEIAFTEGKIEVLEERVKRLTKLLANSIELRENYREELQNRIKANTK